MYSRSSTYTSIHFDRLVAAMALPPIALGNKSEIVPVSQVEAEEPEANYDSFYTPTNRTFYDCFQYETLNPADRRIRLLRVHPHRASEDDNATIKCDLIDDVSLDEYTGKFTTLSYCAGDPRKTETVLVNGVYFNAFANLGHALRQARHFWKTNHADHQLLLWADQVCIDQSNTSERSHQVGFMGEIYAAAQQVLICLSTKEDHGGGMAWLMQYGRDALIHYGPIVSQHEEIFQHNGPSPCEEVLQLGFESFTRSILRSPWWSRVWVRQELMRSPIAFFLASYEALDFLSLALAMEICWRQILHVDGLKDCQLHVYHDEQAVVLPQSCQACIAYGTWSGHITCVQTANQLLRKKFSSNSSLSTFPDLLENLMNVGTLQASDPRDLIYACLGYSSHSYEVEPEYTPGYSLCDVACQLTCNVIVHSDNLNVLRLTAISNQYWTGTRDVEYPSWVFDWRKQCYCTCNNKDMALQARQTVSFHSDDKGRKNRILHARGVLLGAENTSISSVKREGMYKGSDGLGRLDDIEEVWLLHGTTEIYIFLPKGQYRELVGKAYSTRGNWMDEVATLVKNGDPCVQTIRIC
jgi:hypothetical protein